MSKIIISIALFALMILIPSSSTAANPYILECRPCPSGCQYAQIDKCWSECGSCDCSVSSQGNCGCNNQ